MTDTELSAALLLETAEVEHRLRQHVLELVEPVLKKQSTYELRLRECKTSVETLSDDLSKVKRSQEGSDSLKTFIEDFRVELAQWDRDRRDHDQQLGARLTLQETEISGLRQSIERKATDERNALRTLKSLGDILTSTQEELGQLRRYCTERLDLNRDKIAKLRDEFETRTMGLEAEQHRLQDVHTRTEMVISNMKAELGRLNVSVTEAVTGVADLWRSKASVKGVEAQQQEFEEFAQQVNGNVLGLRQQFGNLVDDVKAHFQTAAAVVGTSTAKQMDDMRVRYQEEVKRVDTILQEIDNFFRRQQEMETVVKSDFMQVREESKRELDALKKTFEVNSQKRELDCANLMIEVQQLKKGLKEIDTIAQGEDHARVLRNDILMTVVESQLLSATLDYQDDQDRKSIALFGYKVNDHKQDKACTLPDLDGARSTGRTTPRRKATGEPQGYPVMTVDKRCLSCSGSAATVLAGFKLACLQYAPTPVEYQKVTYSRSELIKLRIDLLNQAKEQLKSIE